MILFLQLLFSDTLISQILLHRCCICEIASIHFLPTFTEVVPTDLDSMCFYAVPATVKTFYHLPI